MRLLIFIFMAPLFMSFNTKPDYSLPYEGGVGLRFVQPVKELSIGKVKCGSVCYGNIEFHDGLEVFIKNDLVLNNFFTLSAHLGYEFSRLYTMTGSYGHDIEKDNILQGVMLKIQTSLYLTKSLYLLAGIDYMKYLFYPDELKDAYEAQVYGGFGVKIQNFGFEMTIETPRYYNIETYMIDYLPLSFNVYGLFF